MVRRALLYVSAVLFLAQVSSAAVPEPVPYEPWIEPHMQALLADTLDRLAWEGIPDEGIVSVIDAEIMWEYSREEGLRPIRLLEPDAWGVIHFSDGTMMAAPPESPFWAQRARQLGGTGSLETLTVYLPVRSIVSKEGYRKAQAYIRVPDVGDLTGIDGTEGQPEGAFNYFGLKRTGTFDVEFGLASQFDSGKGYNDQGKWMTFYSLNGNPWDRPWPPAGNGFPPASVVFLQVYVPANNQLQYHAECTGYQPWTSVIYNVNGARYDGQYQQFRRNTTMVVYGAAKSLKNGWRQVQLATPSDMHLWAPEDTASTRADAPYVSVVTTNKWYCETVNINVVP